MVDFAAADDVIFETFGVAAAYSAGGTGDPVAVTVIREQPSRDAAGFGVALRAGTELLHVRLADVASPAKGDTFTIGAEVLTVQAAPSRDGQAMKWLVEC